jgi:hypothetical protein
MEKKTEAVLPVRLSLLERTLVQIAAALDEQEPSEWASQTVVTAARRRLRTRSSFPKVVATRARAARSGHG